MGKGIVLLWLNYPMYFPSTEEEGRHECKSVFKMFFLSASLLSESCKEESDICKLISPVWMCEVVDSTYMTVY